MSFRPSSHSRCQGFTPLSMAFLLGKASAIRDWPPSHWAIAGALYMSRPYLSKKFKEDTGENIADFILKEKTEEAKRLLRYSDKSLTAIGSYLGFSSASHFSRVFKTYVGSTPSEYREKHQWLVRRWVDSCRGASTRSSLRSLPQRISRDLRMLRPMRIATTR